MNSTSPITQVVLQVFMSGFISKSEELPRVLVDLFSVKSNNFIVIIRT